MAARPIINGRRFTRREIYGEITRLEENNWTVEESLLYNSEMANGEGRGEKAYRLRRNLTIAIAGMSEAEDFGELNAEAKCIEVFAVPQPTKMRPNPTREDAVPGLGTFRMGIHGSRAWGRTLKSLFRGVSDDVLTDPIMDTLLSGQVPGKVLWFLPRLILDVILREMKPSLVMNCHKFIVLTTSQGFMEVPIEDYDRAFTFKSLGQFRPHYHVETNYLVERYYRCLQRTKNDSLLLSVPPEIILRVDSPQIQGIPKDEIPTLTCGA